MNCWMGKGRLGREVDLRYTPGGTAKGRTVLAVDHFGKDGAKTVDWIPIVFWGRTAELASKHLAKGSPVVIRGRISGGFWERKSEKGQRSQLTTEVVVEQMDFVGPPIHRQEAAAEPEGERPRGGKAA